MGIIFPPADDDSVDASEQGKNNTRPHHTPNPYHHVLSDKKKLTRVILTRCHRASTKRPMEYWQHLLCQRAISSAELLNYIQ